MVAYNIIYRVDLRCILNNQISNNQIIKWNATTLCPYRKSSYICHDNYQPKQTCNFSPKPFPP